MSSLYFKRWFAYSYGSLFLLSCMFPMSASLININTPPLWVRSVDVVVAFILVFAAFLLFVVTQKINISVEKKVLSIILSVSSLPMVLLLFFFTDLLAIRWDILLPGLAWAILAIPYGYYTPCQNFKTPRFSPMTTIRRRPHTDPDFQHFCNALDKEFWVRYPDTQQNFEPYNTVDKTARVILAYLDTKAVGCGCFRPMEEKDTIEIKRMYVVPAPEDLVLPKLF